MIPTLVTHGTLVHAASEEVFLASEHMIIQGEAIPGVKVGEAIVGVERGGTIL